MRLELKEEAVVDFIATKSDIAQSETKLIEKIADIKYDLKQEIYNVETGLTEKISDVRQEISDVEVRLTDKISDVKDEMKRQFMWFIATLIAMTGIIISVVKFL